MPAAYNTQVEIDKFKKENPSVRMSDHSIYDLLKISNPTLKWDNSQDSPKTGIAKKRRGVNTSPKYLNAFAEWFDYGIDKDSANFWKAAYNNSLTGLTEQLITGEQRYNLEDYDPNIIEDIASMAASFVMPLDLLAFWGGGKFVGQPLAKLATVGMKKRVGSEFGKRALDTMIPAALNQAGTLATYEGAMGGVLAGINGEDVWKNIGHGVLHGAVMGGAAGLAGGGLAHLNAEVLKGLKGVGKIVSKGAEATEKLDIYDRMKMLSTGLPGQIAVESGVFTAGETLETAHDPNRDVRLKDVLTSLGKNIGLFGLLKGKQKLLQRGKEHVKLLEEHENLKRTTDSLNKNETKESKSFHGLYDTLVEKISELKKEGTREADITANILQERADGVKAKAVKLDKKHFENRDEYKILRTTLDQISKGKIEATPENFSKIIHSLQSLIGVETKLGESGAYKGLTSQIERTKKEANELLNEANKRVADLAEKNKALLDETPEQKHIRLLADARARKIEKIEIPKKEGGTEWVKVENATAEQIEARIKPLEQVEAREIEMQAAKTGTASAEQISQAVVEKQGRLNPLKVFNERGYDTKVNIDKIVKPSGSAKKKTQVHAHDIINNANISPNTKKRIYLGVQEIFPKSGGKMRDLKKVIDYAEFLNTRKVNFDKSTGADFKAYLDTKPSKERNEIARSLTKFYGGRKTGKRKAWGLISLGEGYAGNYMRITEKGLPNIGVLDVAWQAVPQGKATRITSAQKGLMVDVIKNMPDMINLKDLSTKKTIPKQSVDKKTVHTLFESFYKFPKRFSEMLGLKAEDVKINEGTVEFRIGKNRPNEIFNIRELDSNLWDMIVKQKVGKKDKDFLFSTFKQKKQFNNDTTNEILSFLVSQSGITPVSLRGGKKFTSHHFRHSAATDAETIFRESDGKKDYRDLVQQVLLSHDVDKMTRTHYIGKEPFDVNKDLKKFFKDRELITESTNQDAKNAANRIQIASKGEGVSKKQIESLAAQMKTSAEELTIQRKHFEKKFPQLTITLKNNLGKYRGEYVLGRITGKVIEISKGKAGADTMPHEVAHHVVDVLRQFGDSKSMSLIKKGERLFGGEENLVQSVAEYSVGRLRNKSMVSKAKSWIQEFWSNIRVKLGWYTESDITRFLGRKLMTGKIPTGEITSFKAKYQTTGESLQEKSKLNKSINREIGKGNIPSIVLKEAKEAIFGTSNLKDYTKWANVHQVREFNEFVIDPKNWHVNKVEKVNAEYGITPEVSKQHLRDMGVKKGIAENATVQTIKEYRSLVKENYNKPVIEDNSFDWIMNLSDKQYKVAKVLGRAITPVWLVLKNHGGKAGKKISEKLLNHEWAEHVLYKGPGDEGIHLIKKTLGRKKKKYVHLFDIERTEARLNRKKGDEFYTEKGELSSEEKSFYKNMFKEGTPEYEAFNIWTNKEGTGIADFYWKTLFKELSQHRNPSEIAKLKKELNSKRVEGYMTRVWTKRALETIKEDSPWMSKMVEHNLKEAARAEANLWGRNKSTEEISNKRRELENSKEFQDKIRNELYDAVRFGYSNVKNPHLIERGALMPEYINVTNEKGRQETVKVYEDAMENTAEAYVGRMSKFLSTVRYFPEWTGLGSRYKISTSKRLQVEALETDASVGAYAALAIKRQLGVDKTHMESLNRPLYKAVASFTNISAAVGLSSPLSGIKNLMIGVPRSIGDFGLRNTARGFTRFFDSTARADARTKGQFEYGSKSLELERVGWGRFKMSKLFKFNLMTQTENMNRIISSHAGQLYFGETLSGLRGEAGMFNMKTNKGRMKRMMSELWHLNPEEISFLETTKNFNEMKTSQKYAEIMHKVGHFSHVSTQGGTSTVLLPLWMSSREGRPLTLFMRMATSTTIDSYRNFVKPLLDYGNPAPLIRATMAHAVSGGALFFLYKSLLGKEPPVGSELAQDDTFDKVLMNLWRSEFLGVFGELLSPYDREQIAPVMEPVIIRNLTEAKENLHSLLSGGKTFKQAMGDYSRNTVVVWGQAGDWYKRTTSPYYDTFRNTRSWTSKFKSEKGMPKYSNDGLMTRRQSAYRDLRDAVFFGSDKEIALNYWSAYNTIISDLEKKNPNSSPTWRKKEAKKNIKIMFKHFNPLNISDSTQGTSYTLKNDFLKWLTPENRSVAKDAEKQYHFKMRTVARAINNPKYRNLYSAYI